MNQPNNVELPIAREDYEKLVKVAGSEAACADYLARVIQRLYQYHTTFGENLNLEQMVWNVQTMKSKNHEFEKEVGEMRERLKRMTMTQEELMATVDYMRTLSAQARGTASTRALQ